jgi:Polysaccharide lyase
MKAARAVAILAALAIAVASGGCGPLGGDDAPERVDGPGASLDEERHRIPGEEIYRGDFETADLSQWDGYQSVAGDRIRIVGDPVDQGRYAARFEVREGDNPIGFGDRAEVQMGTGEHEGADRWYSWSTMLDPAFPTSAGWQVLTQWHADADGPPPVALQVVGEQIALVSNPYDAEGKPDGPAIVHWAGPLDRGRWHHFRLHVVWSGDDDTGLLQLWHDGRRATGVIRTRTLYPGLEAYLKQGLYRESGESATGIVYHDGLRVSEVPTVH